MTFFLNLKNVYSNLYPHIFLISFSKFSIDLQTTQTQFATNKQLICLIITKVHSMNINFILQSDLLQNSLLLSD